VKEEIVLFLGQNCVGRRTPGGPLLRARRSDVAVGVNAIAAIADAADKATSENRSEKSREA
jgi:hypothetical protein